MTLKNKKTDMQGDITHRHTYTHTYTHSVIKRNFQCGTVESLENPTAARERRNVLKVGHSLKEGKSVCVNVCVSKAKFDY